MLLGGLWHGAGWTFVTWGALHGLYLMLNHAFHSLKARLPRNLLLPRPIAAAAGWTLTMLAVTIAWVFFRSHDMGTAMHVLMILTGQGQGPPEQSILQEVGLIDQWGVKNIWIATLILDCSDCSDHAAMHETFPVVSWCVNRREAAVHSALETVLPYMAFSSA